MRTLLSVVSPFNRHAQILVFLLALPLTAAAETYQVAPDGSGDFPTIADAISNVPSGNTIELLSGTFRGPGNRDLHMWGKDLVIRSQTGDPASCIIDCEGLAPGMWYVNEESSMALLEGISIRNAVGGYAGAIYIQHASPTIRNCVFEDNVAGYGFAGGAIYAQVSTSLIEQCRFERNTSTQVGGGAISAYDRSNLTIRRCTFSQNYALTGFFLSAGAIFIQQASPRIEDCFVFRNDSYPGCGGIVAAVRSYPTISGCTIVGNAGYVASGVFSDYDSRPHITNSIVAFNRLAVGIYCEGGMPIACCDVFGNDMGDWVGCLEHMNGIDGNICADPLFCDAVSDDYSIDGLSPCLPGNHPDGVDCGLIGALGQGCGTPPTGACCFTDGSCLVLGRLACNDQHGTYQGDGATCDPNPCEPTPVQSTTWGQIKASYR